MRSVSPTVTGGPPLATQQRGTITTWHDDKGYGFITPADGSPPIFFHISGLVGSQPRPAEQVVVTYSLTTAADGRTRAVQVQAVTASSPPYGSVVLGIVSSFFLLLIVTTLIVPLPVGILALYGVSSVVTYGLYAIDKGNAIQGQWRVPELTLHLFELVGGWPGALVGQVYQRHKTVKAAYQSVFWGIVGVHIVGLIGYVTLKLLGSR